MRGFLWWARLMFDAVILIRIAIACAKLDPRAFTIGNVVGIMMILLAVRRLVRRRKRRRGL